MMKEREGFLMKGIFARATMLASICVSGICQAGDEAPRTLRFLADRSRFIAELQAKSEASRLRALNSKAIVEGAASLARLDERSAAARKGSFVEADALGSDLRAYLLGKGVDLNSDDGQEVVSRVAAAVAVSAASEADEKKPQDTGVLLRPLTDVEVAWIHQHAEQYGFERRLPPQEAALLLLAQAGRQVRDGSNADWDLDSSRFLSRATRARFVDSDHPGLSLRMFHPSFSSKGESLANARRSLSGEELAFAVRFDLVDPPNAAHLYGATHYSMKGRVRSGVDSGVEVAILSTVRPATRVAGRLAVACAAIDLVACRQSDGLSLAFSGDRRIGGPTFGGPSQLSESMPYWVNVNRFYQSMTDYGVSAVTQEQFAIDMAKVGGQN
ncbi:hypothetical protein KPL74_19010 [Bacillus sp. NP157]|nr:hypothetical protein KPL74_19010 [Bacillus sp. NP157]